MSFTVREAVRIKRQRDYIHRVILANYREKVLFVRG